jgi:hypothetical protein
MTSKRTPRAQRAADQRREARLARYRQAIAAEQAENATTFSDTASTPDASAVSEPMAPAQHQAGSPQRVLRRPDDQEAVPQPRPAAFRTTAPHQIGTPAPHKPVAAATDEDSDAAPDTDQPRKRRFRRNDRHPGSPSEDPGPRLVAGSVVAAPSETDAPDTDDLVATSRPARPPARPLPRLMVALLLVVVGFVVAYGSGAPVLGHSWDWRYLTGGGAAVLLGGVLVRRSSHRVGLRSRLAAFAVTGLLITAFVTGSATSVVIDGKPYLATSPTARAYVLSHDLMTDLDYIAAVDPLLNAEQADARSRFDQYKPAATKLADISTHWARVAATPEKLPSPAFAEVAGKTANAAHWASESMVKKYQLITEPDAAGEATLRSWRNTYTQDVLAAGPLLRDAARLYGIDLVEGAGPHE